MTTTLTPAGTEAARVDLPWEMVREIADDRHVLSVYAAPEFEELSDDGRAWIKAVVEVAFMAGSATLPPSPASGLEKIEGLLFELRHAAGAAMLASEQDSINAEIFADLVSDLRKAEDATLSAFSALLTRAATAEATATDVADYAHKLQVALTGIAGGGSENFVRHGDDFRADIRLVVAKIQNRITASEDRFRAEFRARKDAETQLAALRAERKVPTARGYAVARLPGDEIKAGARALARAGYDRPDHAFSHLTPEKKDEAASVNWPPYITEVRATLDAIAALRRDRDAPRGEVVPSRRSLDHWSIIKLIEDYGQAQRNLARDSTPVAFDDVADAFRKIEQRLADQTEPSDRRSDRVEGRE